MAPAADAAAVAAAESGDGVDHPLEGWRWLRLVLITTSCMICSGLGPGIAVIDLLLAEAGVGSSLCGSGPSPCDEQYLFVSESVTSAMGVASMLFLFVGWLFDRIGGHALSQLGATVLAVGYLLLQIPLYGARHGHDQQTRGWLLVAVIFTETGSSLTTASVMSLTWHFFDMQNTMAASVGASVSAAAIIPNIMSAMMRTIGLSLSSAMLVWLLFVVLAGTCCRYTVPTMEEYRAQAERVLGTIAPTHKMSIWRMLLDANAVLLRHWWLHLILVLAGGAGLAILSVYSGLLGDLGEMMFGSAAAGETLTSTANALTCICGALTAPLVSCVSDRVPRGEFWLLASLVPLAASMSILVARTTWPAQIFSLLCNSQLYCIMNVYSYRHCFAFAGPARVGSVGGVLQMYMSLAYLALSSLVYAWMSSLPVSGPAQLTLPLQTGGVVLTCLLAALAACILIGGLPQEPVALAADTEGLTAVESPEAQQALDVRSS